MVVALFWLDYYINLVIYLGSAELLLSLRRYEFRRTSSDEVATLNKLPSPPQLRDVMQALKFTRNAKQAL